jgi:two-component system response regulator (stage 0 sporulation protein F)
LEARTGSDFYNQRFESTSIFWRRGDLSTTSSTPESTEAAPSILIADDDKDFREMVRQYAHHLGRTTWEASNGLEALWIVKHQRPDVVLLDLRMPRVDGFETLRHIRKFDPSIRLVIVTGDGSDETRHRVESLGLEFLFKPVTLETLETLFARRSV